MFGPEEEAVHLAVIRPPGVFCFGEVHGHRAFLPIPQDPDGYGAGVRAPHQSRHVSRGLDLLAVHRDDDVTGLETGGGGR